MPIRIPDSLPATTVLEGENIFVMTEHRALHQDIRPLNLLILNLMPTKIVTEVQLLRKLSNTPLQIHVQLLRTGSHISQNTDADHLDSFYTTFDSIKDNRYDGMIITGAPVEKYAEDEIFVPVVKILVHERDQRDSPPSAMRRFCRPTPSGAVSAILYSMLSSVPESAFC